MLPRKRGQTIEVRGADPGHRHLDGCAACGAKLAEQAPHRSRRQAITMRMGQYHLRAGASQALDRAVEGGPLDGCVTRAAARQPALEGVTDVACVTGADQGTREVHAGGHLSRRQNACRPLTSGPLRLALEALAHGGEALGPALANVGKMRTEGRIGRVKTQTDDMQRLTIPTAGHLYAVDMPQAEARTGRAGRGTARQRVVIGEGGEAHPARGAEFKQRLRRKHAVGMQAVQVKIGC